MACKIALIGEAFGETEERLGKPFVGGAGAVLDGMLEQAGIDRSEVFISNVFNLRPKPNNDIANLCVGKKELPHDYRWPMLQQGKYIDPKYAPEIARLKAELERERPNVTVALGNTACWALLGRTGIKGLRGYTAPCQLVPGLKILPSWHPAAVMREWSLRTSAVFDLIKAKRESEYPEIRRPHRWLVLQPTLADLDQYWENHLKSSALISIDIETHVPEGFIECIGFAATPNRCLVVPFYDPDKPGRSYWSPTEERKAWEWVRKVCASQIPKLGQNFSLFDIVHLWRYGVRVNAFDHDTMLLHHALQPEEKKDLGFLGATYADDGQWKNMRQWGKSKSPKRDE